VNVFVPNTTILSAAVNQNFSDIATGLSDCLTRDGQAGMTAVLKAVSGSVSAPGITFNADATSGIYLPVTGELGLISKSLGLIVNSSIFQATSATVQSGGSGYSVGDNIPLTGGTAINQTVLKVATLSGSAVATVTVAYPGNYTVVPSNPVSQGSTDGAGTGATFNVTFAAQFSSSVVTDESGNLPWVRLGASSYVSGILANPNAFDLLRSIATAGSGISFNNSSNPPQIRATLSPTLVPNYLSGLTLSAAGGTGTFGIAAGVANDTTNVTLMQLASAYTKTTASWTVGTGNGGLDTGAIANTTSYHVFLIERVDTNVVDVLFSLSPTSPTLPTSYTLFRRIGSMRTDASAHWIAFSQLGDEFLWATPVVDMSNVTVGTGAVTQALTVPTGIKVNALGIGTIQNSVVTTAVLASSLDTTDTAPAVNGIGITALQNAATTIITNIRTNTSAQVRFRSISNNTTVLLTTQGWLDTRGRNG
jgi:hypothetical protein